MFQFDRARLVALLLVFAFMVAAWQLFASISGKTDARQVLEPVPLANVNQKDWLDYGAANICTGEPCLVLEHSEPAPGEHLVAAYLTTYPPENGNSEVLLTTNISYSNVDGDVSLIAKHIPTPDLQEALLQDGIDLDEFREENVLYSVTGMGPWTSATVELPYGAFSQYIFDGFQKIARAKGLDPDIDQLLTNANIVKTEVNDRFDISDLADKAKVAMIVAGPTQTLTYGVAILALLFVLVEIRKPVLRSYSDGLADLIPFTGFFGTLLGVAAGLEVLGLSNVTDDVSKALSLGKIGSSLGFAINTTILAIVVFGFVIVFQYAIRVGLGSYDLSLTTPKPNPGNQGT
ncbi:hypothetical protein [Phaeobacter inhibens]|uniref:hypothetical protein n=1 Tax=Phaeobacter inhibens TaxID=221822 RepID=UPI0021A94928|nr:hypothetical protein [Phaeobacter inhibens]UWS07080.1 hypothetical protein K4K98_12630 [Phaeobacter inhibens]